ncbi:MAG: NAD-dependent epimerase/dehydratase family protein, partial [Bacteroidota bacterium]
MNIIVAGGSGFLGKALLTTLADADHSLVLLSRNPEAARIQVPRSVQVEQWDAKTVGSWANHVEKADAVINLTGESIGGKRWSAQQKEIILSSRIDSTRAVVEAMRQATHRPKVLVNQSAVGYYGNVEMGNVAEDHPRGSDFLGEVASLWEEEARKAEPLGVRVVTPRTGIVLDKHGG